jgi:hypothetical protein
MPNPHLRKGIVLGFELELIVIWKFSPCAYKLVKNALAIPTFFIRP